MVDRSELIRKLLLLGVVLSVAFLVLFRFVPYLQESTNALGNDRNPARISGIPADNKADAVYDGFTLPGSFLSLFWDRAKGSYVAKNTDPWYERLLWVGTALSIVTIVLLFIGGKILISRRKKSK